METEAGAAPRAPARGGVPDRVEQQARQHPGHRHRRDRDGEEVEPDADRGHRAQTPGRERRRGQCGSYGRRSGSAPEVGRERAVAPPGESRGTPERGGGKPSAEIQDRPRIQQQDAETGGGEQRVGLDLPLDDAAAGGEQGERRRPGGRCGPTEKRDVTGAHDGRDRERRRPAEPQEPGEEVHPRRDQPDVKPRDGEQMHQPALTEAILQLGCDAASAAEHQRAHHPPAAAIQGRAGLAEEVANPVGKAGCRAHSAHPCDGERSFRASAPTGARHPAALDLALVSRSGRCTRGPSGRDHASTGDEWAKRGHPAVRRYRLQHPDAEPECAGHPPRATTLRVGGQRQLRVDPAGEHGAGPYQGDRMPNQHQRRADRGHAERTPEMQKAGRETGPIARRQQNGGPRLHRPRLRTDFDSSCRIAAPPRSSERFHHGHIDRRPALLLFQVDLRDHRPGGTGDVAGRNPVEREHQGIVAAHLAAAEIGEVQPQRLVGGETCSSARLRITGPPVRA